MAWRCVMVQKPARLSIQQQQLLICTDTEHRIPLEDLNTLLVESAQTQVTAAALSALAMAGAALLVCDERHLPCGVLLPYAQHSRHMAVAKTQLAASQPRKNRLWQQIVKSKIANQARCLRLMHLEEAALKLDDYARAVQSGDKGNAEAAAAALYFRALFGAHFFRGQENGTNAALNYGYALLRGVVARTLAVYGFLTCLGLHHMSELNAFNLTDDIMEPLRPLVDLHVVQHVSEDVVLTSREKRDLFSLLTMEMLSGGQRHALPLAVERCVQSLVRSLQLSVQPSLMLPGLLPLSQHSYE